MFYDDHSLGSSSLCACVYMLFLCNWILLFVYFLVFVFVFFRWPYKLKKKKETKTRPIQMYQTSC